MANSNAPTKNRLWNVFSAPRTWSLPGRDRGHRRRHRLAWSEGIDASHAATGGTSSKGDDHRLADRTARGQDERRHDARDGRRKDHPQAGRQAPRAEAIRGFPERPGHGPHRVLRHGRDQRDRQDPHCQSRREDRERGGLRKEALDDVRIDDRQGEEPQDDTRDARQDLDDRLDDVARPRGRVLGQVDRAGQTDRGRDQHRDRRDHQGSEQQGADVEQTTPGEPADADQVAQVDAREELQRLERDRVDDESADDDRRQRGRQQDRADDRLAPSTCCTTAERQSDRGRGVGVGHRSM